MMQISTKPAVPPDAICMRLFFQYGIACCSVAFGFIFFISFSRNENLKKKIRYLKVSKRYRLKKNVNSFEVLMDYEVLAEFLNSIYLHKRNTFHIIIILDFLEYFV